MEKRTSGFTLIELMIVLVIIGILAAIAVPNYIAMESRAKEGGTKSNMHLFQITAEDYSVRNNAIYSPDAGSVVSIMPGAGASLRNPFTKLTGANVAWEDRPSVAGNPAATMGLVSYADSMTRWYNIKGVGRSTTPLGLVLSSGQ